MKKITLYAVLFIVFILCPSAAKAESAVIGAGMFETYAVTINRIKPTETIVMETGELFILLGNLKFGSCQIWATAKDKNGNESEPGNIVGLAVLAR